MENSKPTGEGAALVKHRQQVWRHLRPCAGHHMTDKNLDPYKRRPRPTGAYTGHIGSARPMGVDAASEIIVEPFFNKRRENFAITFESGDCSIEVGLHGLVKNCFFWTSLLVVKVLRNDFCRKHRQVLSVESKSCRFVFKF